LDSRFGFAQGFEVFDEEFDQETDWQSYDQNQRSAAGVTDAALRWVAQTGDDRVFLFVHYFDPHASYSPPPPYDRLYTAAGGPRSSTFDDLDLAIRAQQNRIAPPAPGFVGAIRQGLSRPLIEGANGDPLPSDAALAALYAGEVSYLDEQVGRLLEGLQSAGLLDQAIVILTADHGETFWEHGDFWNHGLCLYQTTLRVPLIIRMPGEAAAPADVEVPVSLIDVMPTLLELLELDPPAGVEGVSLRPALEGLPFERGPIFGEATQPLARFEQAGRWGNALKAKTVRQGPWKYIWYPYLDYEELFNLESDAGERENLLIDPTPEFERQRERLRAELDAWISARNPFDSSFNPVQQIEIMERLRSLGYVGGGASADGDPGAE